MTFKTVDRIH